MVDRSHLVVQAAAWRELAGRARRLAGNLLDGPDKDRLLQYSDELEKKAAALESPHGAEEPVEADGAATAHGAPRSPLAAHDRAAPTAKE